MVTRIKIPYSCRSGRLFKPLVLCFAMNARYRENLLKAGKIASQAVAYGKSVVRNGMPLLDIAELIEGKIVELGGKPAFPVNLSINEVAAHATPAYDSTDKAHGLLKVDIGAHVDGAIADTAFSVDLDNNKLNQDLIEAAHAGLDSAVKIVKEGIKLGTLGGAVEKSVSARGFNVVRNLSGHGISEYDVHAGLTIPNYDNGSEDILDEGVYAIEPFSTNGHGAVKDGKPSGIFQLMNERNVRDNFARQVLAFIVEEYRTLPFCSRWIHKKFGTRGLVALRQIMSAGLLHEYAQLVEISGGIVAQAEHTIFVDKDVKVTTA